MSLHGQTTERHKQGRFGNWLEDAVMRCEKLKTLIALAQRGLLWTLTRVIPKMKSPKVREGLLTKPLCIVFGIGFTSVVDAQQTGTNWALQFDGIQNVMNIGGSPVPPPWTVEVWVNRQDAFDDSAILLGDAVTALKLEQYQNTRRVAFTQFGVFDYSFDYIAPTNTWVHLTFVCDNQTYVNGVLLLYVNGTLQDSSPGTIALPLGQIGGDIPNHHTNHMRAVIDEFRIWNVARSASEIKADEFTRIDAATPGLVAYWHFDEGSGASVLDAGPQHHDATIDGTPYWIQSTIPVVPANVVAWGANEYGDTVVPSDLTNAVAIAEGGLFSFALKVDGTVEAWGLGATNLPVDLTNVVQIAAGDFDLLALKNDGSVVSWKSTNVPPALANVVAIASGNASGNGIDLALKNDGSITAWWITPNPGEPDPILPSGLTNVTGIAAGYGLAALKGDGTAVLWGNIYYDPLAGLSNIVAVSPAGVALLATGGVVTWDGYTGQPVITNAVAIAAGGGYAIALTADGTVRAWGLDFHGETDVPPGLSNVVAIAAGYDHSLALVGQGAPFLTTGLANHSVYSGATLELFMTATGAQPISYQWQFNGTNLVGATNAFLIVTNVQPSQASAYQVIVSNSLGIATSQPAQVSVQIAPPNIIIQPQSQTNYPGAAATFTVTAVGSLPIFYQWEFKGVSIPGATASNLVVTNLNDSISGNYSVLISNAIGQVTSVPATLDVTGPIYTPYTFTTLAGYPSVGSADGVGTLSQFSAPRGIAADAHGNLFVADTGNGTIRQIKYGGLASTIAGFAGVYGSSDGTNSSALFNRPSDIAVDTAGNVYVSDTFNQTIRKLTLSGTNWVVTTIAGSTNAGSMDGIGDGASFRYPGGMAADNMGSLFVADSKGIRKLTLSQGNWTVTTIITNSPLGFFSAVTVDTNGTLYATVVGSQSVDQIVQVTPTYSAGQTNWVLTAIAGGSIPGYADGVGTNTLFNYAEGITVNPDGSLYVTDTGNHLIRKLTYSTANWIVTTLAGHFMPQTNQFGYVSYAGGYGDGTGTNSFFNGPGGIAADNFGNLYVADSGNSLIRKVTTVGNVRTIAGSPPAGNVDGVGPAARFNNPTGLTVDVDGNVYVADTSNCTIREITPFGLVITLAGSAGHAGNADGIGSDAQFNHPTGIAVDKGGNLYVVDQRNLTIRMITPAGVVSTIVGSTNGFFQRDGTNLNAYFEFPIDVSMGPEGSLYVLDAHKEYTDIRKVTPIGSDWVVTTLNGTLADDLEGIAVDNDTNLYTTVAPAQYNESFIEKYVASGDNWVPNLLAGTFSGYGYVDGNGTNALFGYPIGVAVDTNGNIFVADSDNNNIRRITPTGFVTTIAGQAPIVGRRVPLPGPSAGSADGSGSAARFNHPWGVAVDSAGIVYVADSGNNTIRKGVFTAYAPVNPVPYDRPAMDAQLIVKLLPPEAGGQWRFPWELGWRDSGQAAKNLVKGSYDIEFRSVPGWLVFPSSLTVDVTPGSSNYITTNVYYPTLIAVTTNSTSGLLTVNLGANPPAGAAWGFLGDSTLPALPSGYTTNLLSGTYLIEFAGPFSGRSTPPNASVQVFAGVPTVISVDYTLSDSRPGSVLLPVAVPATNISNLTDYSFGFNGQLLSDVGFGSGVAVQTNVVLTAAHLVFNDQTMSFVSHAYWFFQQEKDVFAPFPLPARGWYLLSSYSARGTNNYAIQRTNDLTGQGGQIYAPDVSSAESRNLDAAALYFLSPGGVAGGGYSGYLPSDAVPNSWLGGTAEKMLVGYPVDGSLFGDATIIPGLMYQTGPQPYPLSMATDQVNEQQGVYVASWFLSYPGNSGGPLCVQFNGYYYPAGIYLGTLYNGSSYQSAVRAIDSNIGNLITLAAALGDAGTNYTGGGIITIVAGQGISAANKAYVGFNLLPLAAVQAGAGWRVQGDASYSPSGDYETVTSTNAINVEFAAVPGWNPPPTNQMVAVYGGQITNVTAFYSDLPPSLSYDPSTGLRLFGASGLTYRIESSTNLSLTSSWITNAIVTLTNLTLTNNSQVISDTRPDDSTMRFFRAVKPPQ
jgi:sugar lactone lactonase YvrE